jgi:hypothetical protein
MSRRFWIALFAAAWGVRVAALIVLDSPGRGMDTSHHEHATIARHLALGEGFRFNFFGWTEQPVLTSQQAPLVPGLLAAFYLLFGVESYASFLAMLLLQSSVSAATVVGVAAVVDKVGGTRRAILLAAVAATFYPAMIASALHIQALVWNLAWLTLMLWGTLNWRTGDAVVGGAALTAGGALGMLTDPILGAVLAAMTLLLAWESRGSRKRLAAIGCMAAIVTAALAPWTIRNAMVHGRFILVKDSFFYVFWQGNNHQSQGTDKLLLGGSLAQQVAGQFNPWTAVEAAGEVRKQCLSVDATLPESVLAELVAMPCEIDRMDRFRQMAFAELTADPWHYVEMCARRLRYWLLFDETNPRSFVLGYRATYLLLAGLGWLGLWQSRRQAKEWAPVYASMAALTAVHVLIITSARFRVPMELLLIPSAAVATTAIPAVLAELFSRLTHFTHLSRSKTASGPSL